MKANKTKTSKKSDKKIRKREVKAELESSITQRFLEAVKGLGLDAGKFSKDIQKTSKLLARKLSDKYGKLKAKLSERDEQENITAVKKLKRPVTSAKKAPASASKAEKVISKATAKASLTRSVTGSSSGTSAIDAGKLPAQPLTKKAPRVRQAKPELTPKKASPQGKNSAPRLTTKNTSVPIVKIEDNSPDTIAPSNSRVKIAEKIASGSSTSRSGRVKKTAQPQPKVVSNSTPEDAGEDLKLNDDNAV